MRAPSRRLNSAQLEEHEKPQEFICSVAPALYAAKHKSRIRRESAPGLNI